MLKSPLWTFVGGAPVSSEVRVNFCVCWKILRFDLNFCFGGPENKTCSCWRFCESRSVSAGGSTLYTELQLDCSAHRVSLMLHPFWPWLCFHYTAEGSEIWGNGHLGNSTVGVVWEEGRRCSSVWGGVGGLHILYTRFISLK